MIQNMIQKEKRVLPIALWSIIEGERHLNKKTLTHNSYYPRQKTSWFCGGV